MLRLYRNKINSAFKFYENSRVRKCKKEVDWREKVTQAELRRAEAEEALSNYGLCSVTDPEQPYLVNVNRVRISILHCNVHYC